MDTLDVQILREMGVQPYGALPRSPATLKAPHIAKRLGVNPERVADRIARLHESGVVLGYDVYPNYRHLNLDVACFWMRARDDAQATRALEEAAHVDGIASVYAFLGGELNISACGSSPNDVERKVALLARLVGEAEYRKLYDLVTPPVRRALDHVDWRIIQALRGNAMRSNEEVAERVGVSAKTVSRRVERMAEEGAFFVIPELDIQAAEGMVIAQIWLTATHRDIAALPRLASEALGGAVLTMDELIPHDGVTETQFAVAARSVRELESLVERAKALPGASGARALLFRDAREDYAWLDDAIAGRVRATR